MLHRPLRSIGISEFSAAGPLACENSALSLSFIQQEVFVMAWPDDHYREDGILHGVWEGKPALKTWGPWWVLIKGAWKPVKDDDAHLTRPDEFKRMFPALPPLPSEAFAPRPEPAILTAVWQGRPTIFCCGEVWDLTDGAWQRVSPFSKVYSNSEFIPPDEFKRRFPSLPPLPREALEGLERLKAEAKYSKLRNGW
jgi:hypothetical protein